VKLTWSFHQTSEDERCAQWLTDRYAYIVSKKAGSGGSAGQYLGDSDWVGSSIPRHWPATAMLTIDLAADTTKRQDHVGQALHQMVRDQKPL
jgi:hypothetical protein